MCTKPIVMMTVNYIDAGSNATESVGAKCVESDSAAVKSSTCPPSDTNSPEMSTATCSNDTQTSIIINENDIKP